MTLTACLLPCGDFSRSLGTARVLAREITPTNSGDSDGPGKEGFTASVHAAGGERERGTNVGILGGAVSVDCA